MTTEGVSITRMRGQLRQNRQLAIKTNKKYTFHTAFQLLMEHFDIANKSLHEYLYFPFRDNLGVTCKTQDESTLPLSDFNNSEIEAELFGKHEELVNRLLLQCDNGVNIFRAYSTPEERMGEIAVDFRLYEYCGGKYPLVFYQDELSLLINTIMYDGSNTDLIQNKIHIGEYLHLIKESGRSLNYEVLKPYEDVWNLDDFLENKNLQWDDIELFYAIANYATGAQWSTISRICPIDILKSYIEKFKENFDWVCLTERYDDDCIVDTATQNPWDFEQISTSRSVELIKRLIVIPELHENVDWDWEAILPQLDDNFIIGEIPEVSFRMYSLTDQYLSHYPDIIAANCDRQWNWDIVSNQAGLEYLLANISALGVYLPIEGVMSRAFGDELWCQKYCDSSEFAFVVIEHKEGLHNRYQANSAPYIWTNALIRWHEKMGFITWKTIANVDGFECNKNLIWTDDFFEEYKDRDFSIKGLNHISQNILYCKCIDSNIDFKWTWNILSQRDIVQSNVEFIKRHLVHLNLNTIVSSINPNLLVELYPIDVFKQLAATNNLWKVITERIPEALIRQNFDDINWDWHVLTRRFCSSLHVTQLGDARWGDKLDWEYISDNYDIEKIQEHLELYTDRWNWSTITNRVEHDFLIDNLPEFYDLWDWKVVINKRLSDEDIVDNGILLQIATIFSQLVINDIDDLWVLLTKRYTTSDIINIINSNTSSIVDINWNYKDLYNRADFEIEPYLASYSENNTYIDWDALSSSKALDKILRWDKQLTKDFRNWEDLVLRILEDEDYDWNFSYLSTLTSINWCDSILKVREDEWDWSYLSENSKCFSFSPKKPKELFKHIDKFARHLDFAKLSSRKDLKLSLDNLESLHEYDWDWSIVSSNSSIELSAEYVSNHSDRKWDWNVLSTRKDCTFNIEFIAAHPLFDWNWSSLSRRRDILLTSEFITRFVNNDWNWNEIARRTDIKFDAKLIQAIQEKNINWKIVSQRDDFCPTVSVLNILKDKDIDWTCISKREELPFDVLVIYKDYLDWTVLSHSSHVNLQDPRILELFQDYLDWNYVSSTKEFSLSFDNIEKFKNFINWSTLFKRHDFTISEEIIDHFEDYLDWERVSRCTTVEFAQLFIDKYISKWDWVALSENPAFNASGIVDKYKAQLKLSAFYKTLNLHCNRRPCIYHFTHMFNAIEIIRSRKILSRNRATEMGLLKYDAAGSVVNRSEKAHPFARFYYRTGTQTQFYNECLGKECYDDYYDRALRNGLPMCPMPVFFRFDLKEVLSKQTGNCFYSTGNLQTNWAQIYKVMENPCQIDASLLYSSGFSKSVQEKKQQEFLIKGEFDFSNMENFEIICYDEEERDILKTIFTDDPICEKIHSSNEVEDVYERKNPFLDFSMTDDQLSIKTQYRGDYIFQIESQSINKIKVVNKSDIKTIKKNIIQLRKSLSVELGDTPFDVYYVSTNTHARSPRWLVYQYVPKNKVKTMTETEVIENTLGISFEDDVFTPEDLITALELAMPKLEGLYNTKVRHYLIKKHTLLVCNQFEKYPFKFSTEHMNLDLMRVILAMHDIGKAVDRVTQHEHTISIMREFWKLSPCTSNELMIAESLLKDDHIGEYFVGKYDLGKLCAEIIQDAQMLNMQADILLQFKMILYQCDIASYTKDAGGLKYLEHMFVYENGEKQFDEDEGLLQLSSDYQAKYNNLKDLI